MKLIDSVMRAGRSLRTAKVRTILTSLSIGVGAFTLTIALAAGEGARQYADKLIKSNIDPQTVLAARDKSLFEGGARAATAGLREYNEDAASYAGLTVKALTWNDIEAIKSMPEVKSVMPSYLVNAKFITFEGRDQKYTSDITTYDPSVRAEAVAGSMPALGTQLQHGQIVIPQSYAEALGKKPSDMIGRKVVIHLAKAVQQPSQEQIMTLLATQGPEAVSDLLKTETKEVSFTIAAVSATSSTSFSASMGLFIAESMAKELSDYTTEGTPQYQKYLAATVIAKSDVKPDDLKAKLESKGIVARTAKDLQELLFTIVNILQGIVFGFGVLALITSVFGIINTQYISVLERTREIGLMKALGMRGRHVSRLFQLEAAWIGFLGGVLGSVVAVMLGSLLNPWISKQLTIGDNSILIFQPLPVVALIAGLMLVAMIAGWFPARKAAKLDPIEALRTE